MNLNTLSLPLVGKANKNKPSIMSLTTDQGWRRSRTEVGLTLNLVRSKQKWDISKYFRNNLNGVFGIFLNHGANMGVDVCFTPKPYLPLTTKAQQFTSGYWENGHLGIIKGSRVAYVELSLGGSDIHSSSNPNGHWWIFMMKIGERERERERGILLNPRVEWIKSLLPTQIIIIK